MTPERIRIRLGGLWKHMTQKGEVLLSGPFGQGQLVIFTNGFKKGEHDPDYVMYLEPKPEKPAGAQPPNRS